MLCVQSAGNESTPEGSCLANRVCCLRNHRKVNNKICSFFQKMEFGGGEGGEQNILLFAVLLVLNTLLLFQLDTLLFSFYLYNFLLAIFFSTCFGPAGPSSGESNYTCSLWHLSLVRCYLVRGRW